MKVAIHAPHIPGPVFEGFVTLREFQYFTVIFIDVKVANALPAFPGVGFWGGNSGEIKGFEAALYCCRARFVHANTKHAF